MPSLVREKIASLNFGNIDDNLSEILIWVSLSGLHIIGPIIFQRIWGTQLNGMDIIGNGQFSYQQNYHQVVLRLAQYKN